MDEENKNVEVPKKELTKKEELAEREELVKKEEDIAEREAKIKANNLLGSSAGGHQELPEQTEEEKKVKGAEEFFKGTQLEKDIKKANEKK